MKDKITLKEFFESKDKLVIRCDTEEKANKLLKEFDKLGKNWWTGEGYLENTCFDTYKDETCYSNAGEYEQTEHYKDENTKIYSFEDVIFEEQDKPKNLIPEIAKMLGVEIGEEFIVEKNNGKDKAKFRFLDNEFVRYDGDFLEHSEVLFDIILQKGKYTIKKLPKKPQLTDAERVILENLPKEYKWIARDKNGYLYVYADKPEKNNFIYKVQKTYYEFGMFNHLFQFIKWEDEEPYNIEELLKGE